MTIINDRFKQIKRIIGGIYKADPVEVADGDQVALSLDNIGRVKISCVPFDPINGAGDNIAFTATATRSGQLTIGGRYWLWATKSCYLAFGDNSIDATSSDFPLPPGAVVEYMPSTDRDYISAIRITDTGILYIGRAA